MDVLILGGTGVISRQIVNRLLTGGHRVSVFHRGSKQLPFAGEVETLTGDKSDEQAFRQLMRGRRFDAVIDMICFDESDARVSFETFRGAAGQLIVCSSSAAYKRPFRSVPVREDLEELTDDPVFPYAYHKAEAERYLRQASCAELPVTIIRPSLTYGEGGANLGVLRQNVNIAHRIRAGKPLVMFGDGRTPWSFTFAPDLAKAFVGAVGNPKTYGQAYHATSEEVRIWDDLYLEFGRILGIKPHIVHLPSELLMKADPALFSHLYYEKSYPGLFDNAKIKRDIPEFQVEISLHDGLRMMLDWYEREGHLPDPDKERLEDRLVDMHRQWANACAQLSSKQDY